MDVPSRSTPASCLKYSQKQRVVNQSLFELPLQKSANIDLNFQASH